MLSPSRSVGLAACGAVGIMLVLGPAAHGDDGFVTTRRHETGVTIEVESTSSDKSKGSTGKDAQEMDRASEKSRPQTSNGGRIGVGATILEPSVDAATPSSELRVASRADILRIPECFDVIREQSWCQFVPPPPAMPGETPPAFTPPTRDQVEAIVRRLASRMDLPKPMPNIGPDPNVNEWNMAVVGYPLWLWVDGVATMRSQVSGYGITITLDARRTKTIFSMGDGKSVTCVRMSAYTKGVKPATPSPTCGYTYSWPSLPQGRYHVTAASQWIVDWTALGYSGSIPIAVTGERDLPVGELHSLNKAP